MEGDRKVKKIKVNKETAKFFKLLEATLLVLIMMFGILGCTSLTPFPLAGWLIEIIMIIMFLVLKIKIEKKPDINNANGNEQHVVQQLHGKNKEDESSLLFLIIFISIVLAYSFVSTFVGNYYLH